MTGDAAQTKPAEGPDSAYDGAHDVALGGANGTRRTGPSLAYWHHLLVVLFVLLVALYFGSGFLVPLSVAVLNFMLLTAIIDKIANWRPGGHQVPRWLAGVLGLAAVVIGFGTIVSILVGQADEVATAMPRYQARFEQIAGQIMQLAGDDVTDRVVAELAKLDLSGVFQVLAGNAGSMLSGLSLVLLYVPFMMVERAPMRAKIRLAAGTPEQADDISRVVNSISLGVQRYIGIKTLVSLLTGTLSYLVMKFAGLDFAETWGVLAFALNFIPTIGSIIGVVVPSIVALVQFETLGPFLMIALGCGVIQFVIGNILEPSLTGRSLNLSPLMVILALTFWSILWGVAGAFLSVPITVTVMIILANFPGTRPLAILMSGDGNLALGTGGAEDTTEKPTRRKVQHSDQEVD